MSIRSILFVTLVTVGLFMAALHAGALACLPGSTCPHGSGQPSQGQQPPKEEQWWKSGSYPGAWNPGTTWGKEQKPQAGPCKGGCGKPAWKREWSRPQGKPHGK